MRCVPRRPSTSRSAASWAALDDEPLLDLRLRDLDLRIEGTPLEARVAKLHDELAARGLRFRPHCWLSTEWRSFRNLNSGTNTMIAP